MNLHLHFLAIAMISWRLSLGGILVEDSREINHVAELGWQPDHVVSSALMRKPVKVKKGGAIRALDDKSLPRVVIVPVRTDDEGNQEILLTRRIYSKQGVKLDPPNTFEFARGHAHTDERSGMPSDQIQLLLNRELAAFANTAWEHLAFAALRECREETGHSGTLRKIGPFKEKANNGGELVVFILDAPWEQSLFESDELLERESRWVRLDQVEEFLKREDMRRIWDVTQRHFSNPIKSG